MAKSTLAQKSLKTALKAALVETIKENRELVKEIFHEVLEDIVLKQAIGSGLRTKKVSKNSIIAITSGLK